MNQLILIMIGFVTGVTLGIVIFYLIDRSRREKARGKASDILSQAKKDADDVLKKATIEAKETYLQLKQKAEEEYQRLKDDIIQQQKENKELQRKLQSREDVIEKRALSIDNREERIEKKEENLKTREKNLEGLELELEKNNRELVKKLEQIASLSQEEAKKMIISQMEEEAKNEAVARLRQIEQDTREKANKKARTIITTAMQHIASDVVSENAVTVFPLASDDFKGRIIGREGRNIRALEATTGVNIIIDDTPEAVVLSSFDPLRREIARISLERLLADGRIHPTRIETIVEKVKKEINEEIKEIGNKVCMELNVYNLAPELVQLLGRLKYRTSYGQNVLNHSKEAALLAQNIANELGIDPTIPKRAGLLHDIGKAVDFEFEGTHSSIGAELAKKHGEPPVICHAIAAHHGDMESETLVDVISQIVDAVSAARPGARRENLETYLKRLQKLEEIANSFEGVEKAYAIQAGREVRIIVQPNTHNDNNCYILAQDVKKRIENELQYPGQIQVTVIREKRVIDYAK